MAGPGAYSCIFDIDPTTSIKTFPSTSVQPILFIATEGMLLYLGVPLSSSMRIVSFRLSLFVGPFSFAQQDRRYSVFGNSLPNIICFGPFQVAALPVERTDWVPECDSVVSSCIVEVPI